MRSIQISDERRSSQLPLMSKRKHCPFLWHRIFLLHLLETKLESFPATKAAEGGIKNSFLQLLPFEGYQIQEHEDLEVKLSVCNT